MFTNLLVRLACPACHGPLDVVEARHSGAHCMEEGNFRCRGCGRVYPVTGGVPRLLPDAPREGAASATRASFERQWRHYGSLHRIFGKDRSRMRENLVNERIGSRIRADWYRGRVVLDAGCGHGRYLEAFMSLGATVVGVDVGTGPERAGVPLDDARIHVVQGDVLHLPFADAQFDLAFCDGVLHHTTDPRAGFSELVRVVKPGGAVYAWLYPREGRVREAIFGAARSVTTRLPGPIVRGLCFLLAPLTAFVRSYSGTKFPRATWGECAQVVHDWLSPPLQSHHTFEEVSGWARDAGLGDVERLPIPFGIVAWKPAR